MTKQVYTCDMKVWATAYIVAESEDEAQRLADSLSNDTLVLENTGDPLVTDCEINTDMPQVSLSPMATIEAAADVDLWED